MARLTLRLSAAHTTPSPASAKPDGSLVTACDQAIERNLGEEILKRFPSSAFRAEEKQVHGAPDADLLWTTDPLDGTTPEGAPVYAGPPGLARRWAAREQVTGNG